MPVELNKSVGQQQVQQAEQTPVRNSTPPPEIEDHNELTSKSTLSAAAAGTAGAVGVATGTVAVPLVVLVAGAVYAVGRGFRALRNKLMSSKGDAKSSSVAEAQKHGGAAKAGKKHEENTPARTPKNSQPRSPISISDQNTARKNLNMPSVQRHNRNSSHGH